MEASLSPSLSTPALPYSLPFFRGVWGKAVISCVTPTLTLNHRCVACPCQRAHASVEDHMPNTPLMEQQLPLLAPIYHCRSTWILWQIWCHFRKPRGSCIILRVCVQENTRAAFTAWRCQSLKYNAAKTKSQFRTTSYYFICEGLKGKKRIHT